MPVEQRLYRENFTRWHARLENCQQLALQISLAIASCFSRGRNGERLYIIAGHSSESLDVARLHKRDNTHRISRRNGGELPSRRWHSIEDDRVSSWRGLLAPQVHRHFSRVSESTKKARHRQFLFGRADDDRCRWWVEIIQQSPQGAHARRGRDGHVLKGNWSGCVRGFRFVHTPGATQVPLDEKIQLCIRAVGHDNTRRIFWQLRHYELDSGARFGIASENVVCPGDHQRPHVLQLELASANEPGKVNGRSGDCQNGTALHQSRGPSDARHREKLDATKSGKPQDRLGQGDCALRILGNDYELGSTGARVDPLERCGEESRHGLNGLGQNVHDIAASASRGLSFFGFQDSLLHNAM